VSRAARSEQRGRNDEGGAALVEFAFVAILLFMLVFGIITYGYMMSFRQAVTQAAAEGARAGAVAPSGSSSTAALNAVNQALAGYGGLDCTGGGPCTPCNAVGMTCTITGPLPCTSDVTHSCITVTVEYAYRANPLLPAPPFLNMLFAESLEFTSVAETN
jgi:Flp pilus assembly protein TadG